MQASSVAQKKIKVLAAASKIIKHRTFSLLSTYHQFSFMTSECLQGPQFKGGRDANQ